MNWLELKEVLFMNMINRMSSVNFN